jgi:hypothetical protein
VTNKVVLEKNPLLSVVASSITNAPAAVGVTTTEAPSLAPVIVARWCRR